MGVQFPLFVFEKDDCSMLVVEKQADLFSQLEEYDIQRDEYLFWDVNGAGVCLRISKKKIVSIENCETVKPLNEAFLAYSQSLGLITDLSGKPTEVWTRILNAEKMLPRKKGLFARLSSRRINP